MLLSLDEARFILHPIEERLAECALAAFREFREFQTGRFPTMHVRSRRTLVQDLAWREVSGAFSGVPGFRIVDPHTGRNLLCVANRLLLQVKQVNREFRTSNLMTKTAERFNAQEVIEGMPPLPRVTMGIRLNSLETEVEGVYIIYSICNRPEWWYRIGRAGEDTPGAEVITFTPPVQPTGRTERVTPKQRESGDEVKVIPIFGRRE